MLRARQTQHRTSQDWTRCNRCRSSEEMLAIASQNAQSLVIPAQDHVTPPQHHVIPAEAGIHPATEMPKPNPDSTSTKPTCANCPTTSKTSSMP